MSNDESECDVTCIILELVCPIVGIGLTNAMNWAPFVDARKAARHGTLGDLNPTPWAIMLGNNIGWVLYSFVAQDYFVFGASGPGVLSAVFLNLQAVKVQYENARAREMRKSIVNALEVHHREVSRSLHGMESSANSQSEPPDMEVASSSQKGGSQDDERTSPSFNGESSYSNGPIIPHPNMANSSQAGNTSRDMSSAVSTSDQASSRDHFDVSSPYMFSAVIPMDFARVVWDVAAQKTRAPARHEHLVMAVLLVWLGAIAAVAFTKDHIDKETRYLIVGSIASANMLFFYVAPLSIIFSVFETQSSASIHVPSVITSTLNGVFWTAYGLAVQDYFLGATCGACAILGIVQVVLCIVFPSREIPKGDSDLPANAIVYGYRRKQQVLTLNGQESSIWNDLLSGLTLWLDVIGQNRLTPNGSSDA